MSFSPSTRYAERSFVYRLSEKLSKKESNALVSIHDLPARLRDESPFDVLMQLEMQRRYSTLEELASILKDINRDDLAKEVTTFAKKNKKKLTKAEYTQPHRSANANLECALQMTKLQYAILMDQTHKLREAANDAGHKRIEEIVRNGLKSASEQMNKKLQYISKLLHTAKTQTKKHLSSSSSTSSESSSLEGSLESDSDDSTYATIRPCDIKSTMVTSRSPTSREQQVPALSKLSPLPKARVDSGKTLPAPSVRSRDDVKPKQLEVPAAVADDDDDYSEMTSTSTGDSGFADSRAFIKEEPRRQQIQPPAQQTASYTGLNRHTMEHVGYYKTAHKEIDDIQDVIYEVTPTESVADGPEYINVPTRQRN